MQGKVRALTAEESGSALDLAWLVFKQFEALEYGEEGTENFRKTINDPEFTQTLRFYGAFAEDQLVGMLATRNEGKHISLFFVREAYQRCGIGRSLFQAALNDAHCEAVTVNSSPFAVKIYRRLGFVAIRDEQVTDGIRYTPMRYDVRRV